MSAFQVESFNSFEDISFQPVWKTVYYYCK